MSSKSTTSHPDNSATADDSFWSALFAQEESLSPTDLPDPQPDWQPPAAKPKSAPTPPVEEPTENAANPWQLAREWMEKDQTLTVRISSYNRGGLIVHWQGIQGFVPASQLLEFPQFHIEQQRVQALRERVSQWIELKIIEVNPDSNRLILSERASRVKATTRHRLLQDISKGDTLSGTVSNLTAFGAFVDLGGVEGLIHISELSWSRVTHPSKVLQPGQEVEALVLEVDQSAGRIALSRKRLRNDPWLDVEQRYHPGQMVEGVVTNIVSYGVFVILEEELEGLIHISELAEGNFLHPRNVVQQGERVRACILSVSGRKKRLALSLRATPNGLTES